MQFVILLYVVVVMTISLQRSSTVEAKLVMTVLFNGGVLPTNEGFDCNDHDSHLITTAIGTEGDDDDDDEDEDDRRHLKSYPSKCTNACLHYAPRSCRSAGCSGYRRRSLQNVEDISSSHLRSSSLKQRQLDDDDDDAAICADGMAALNTKLDELLPQLSSGCQYVVQNLRTVSCFDDVRYATINGFALWNADTDTIVQADIKNNTSFCYTNSNLNIEAVANACVEEMDMSIKGPVSRSREIESLPPYSIFGNVVESYNFSGRKLPVGTYTVRTTLEGSLTPSSRVTFTVKNC
jgi:hypothetical protein